MGHRRSNIDRKSYDPSFFLSDAGSKACAAKKKFDNEEEVALEAESIYATYYKCSYCCGYHLTSKEKKNK